ncbi:sodium-translocating pyrophosphatase [bacterium]|nr:sodium-translocating pyrophosphatase [bacterium]
MDFIPAIWLLAPSSALIALLTAFALTKKINQASEGTSRMQEIAGYVKEGAMAYLTRQYRVVGIVFAILFLLLGYLSLKGIQNPFVPFAFLSGGLWSGLCGFLGMKTATNAAARTAAACQTSLSSGLRLSFRAGAVMGLVVVGFGLLDISVWFFGLNWAYGQNLWGISNALLGAENVQNAILMEITTTLLTYCMGASVLALFARVGGGIFTKAADVGADLVGKVEAGIPEDDPRNPAVIADNVGDNVGDVAGMGADLYESYCGSILATASLGASLAISLSQPAMPYVVAPMIVAGGGILASLVGIFFVKAKEGANQKQLLQSLLIGTGVASVLIIGFLFLLFKFGIISLGIFGSVVIGLATGTLIGQFTEYYTSDHYAPTKEIATASTSGPATLILQGIATGMLSTGILVLIVVAGIILSFVSSGGLESINNGIYGIGFAAIGMLSTLGITLATDAFGPIADNAGGNAEMAELPPEVRERTDALDSLGNTTAATGKGFAMGSAALTALALIAAYLETVKHWIHVLASNGTHFVNKIGFTNNPDVAAYNSDIYFIGDLSINSIVSIFKINVINPNFLSGLFIGSMVVLVFSALTILAVRKAASEMVEEVRRQFRTIPGIMEGKNKPDYARCVDISTGSAQRTMLAPSLLAITAPLFVGFVFGVAGVVGLLVGTLSTGFSFAIFLNNTGGAWDNAKKYIEKGQFGGKGSEAHKASVIGDTCGDPFKDTSGPSINILLKLMTIVSIVFAGLMMSTGSLLP